MPADGLRAIVDRKRPRAPTDHLWWKTFRHEATVSRQSPTPLALGSSGKKKKKGKKGNTPTCSCLCLVLVADGRHGNVADVCLETSGLKTTPYRGLTLVHYELYPQGLVFQVKSSGTKTLLVHVGSLAAVAPLTKGFYLVTPYANSSTRATVDLTLRIWDSTEALRSL